MYKTPNEITRTFAMSEDQAEDQKKIRIEHEEVDSGEAAEKHESHITIVPFNPVQTGSFQ